MGADLNALIQVDAQPWRGLSDLIVGSEVGQIVTENGRGENLQQNEGARLGISQFENFACSSVRAAKIMHSLFDPQA